MGKSDSFRRLRRVMAIGEFCDKHKISTEEGIERIAAMQERDLQARPTRRNFIGTVVGVAAAGAIGITAGPIGRAFAAPRRSNVDVGIVGAGLAGLACADTLRVRGVAATIYEGRDRIGGRQWSMGGIFPGPVNFPGQVVERGGELVDNLHLTMKAYGQEFGLQKEDFKMEEKLGETFWYFDGAHVPEALIVDEWRALVDTVRSDLARLSSEVTVTNHSEYDRQMDFTNMREYLISKGVGTYIFKAIEVAYTIEFGREIEEQSILNLLFFIHIDKRSRFQPFGVYSDERWHFTDGNQQVALGIASRLPGPIELESRLIAVRKLSDGRILLTFRQGGRTFEATHDAVVLAIPYTMVRELELHANLGIPAWKMVAINEMVYGTNAKLNIGFNGKFWMAQGGNGITYSDLPNHQNTWQVNPTRATADHAVLVDYSGGLRGASLNPSKTQNEAKKFLTDLDRVYPGALANTSLTANGMFLAHLQHWSSDPFIKGSYVSNHPGYFTTIAGNEATPVNNLFFAGEHTDSFYEWQGFMEGAANSGIRAAQEILAAF